MTQSYFLKTARLGFRQWTEGDLLLAMAIWGDSRVTTFVGGPFSPAWVQARLASEIDHQRQYCMQYWPTFLLDGDRHAGCTGLHPYRPDSGVFELGFYLRPEFWGMGLTFETASAAADYGFTELGAEALFAGHHPDNHASRGVLLKLGFVYQGIDIYPPTGELEPQYLLRKPSGGATDYAVP